MISFRSVRIFEILGVGSGLTTQPYPPAFDPKARHPCMGMSLSLEHATQSLDEKDHVLDGVLMRMLI